ncbi:hypothetical protein DMENIID0001_157060 [Sergentomyia squamirostris]
MCAIKVLIHLQTYEDIWKFTRKPTSNVSSVRKFSEQNFNLNNTWVTAILANVPVQSVERKSKKGAYTEESLKNALKAASNGMSLRKASRHYGIPASTLGDKLSGRSKAEKFQGTVILSPDVEQRFVDWILKRAHVGYPVTKNELKDAVALHVKLCGFKTRFRKDRPGRVWLKCFFNRHPDAADKIRENFSTLTQVIEKDVEEWFSEVQEYLKQCGLSECETHRIFNCDEIAFSLCPPVDEGLAERDAKYIRRNNGNKKQAITCLFMGSAAGDLLPPMVVLPYDRIPGDVKSSIPSSWAIGRTISCTMTAESFYEYIVNCFYPWLMEKQIQLPVIVYVNGNSSNLTLPLNDFCTDKGIEIIRLFPNDPHANKPMDVKFFPLIKKIWRDKRYTWNILNSNTTFKVKDFAPLLEQTLQSVNTQEILKNSFRQSALYRFDQQVLDAKKFVAETKEKEPRPSPSTSCSLDNTHDLNCSILRGIRNSVPDAILHQFEEFEHDQWKGPEKYADLFVAWCHFKDMLKTVTQNVPEDNQTYNQKKVCKGGKSFKDHIQESNLVAKVKFECALCGGRFRWLRKLKRHMNTHMSAGPFPCNTCRKTFKSNDHLKLHKKNTHEMDNFQ